MVLYSEVSLFKVVWCVFHYKVRTKVIIIGEWLLKFEHLTILYLDEDRIIDKYNLGWHIRWHEGFQLLELITKRTFKHLQCANKLVESNSEFWICDDELLHWETASTSTSTFALKVFSHPSNKYIKLRCLIVLNQQCIDFEVVFQSLWSETLYGCQSVTSLWSTGASKVLFLHSLLYLISNQ